MTHVVGTTKAAYLLGICCQRVRQLLAQGRIKGAKKVGQFWQIPLFHGMPKVLPGKRGPKGTWSIRLRRSATYIHVNQYQIRKNKHHQTQEPVIIVRRGNRTIRCHEVHILGESKLVYQPNLPKPCGATVWLEIDPSVEVIPRLLTTKLPYF